MKIKYIIYEEVSKTYYVGDRIMSWHEVIHFARQFTTKKGAETQIKDNLPQGIYSIKEIFINE